MRRVLVVLVIVAVATAMSMVPAFAGKANTPVGEKVGLFDPVAAELEAGESFHVIHGFGLDPSTAHPVGPADFRLDIDGIDQGKGKLINVADGQYRTRRWLHNYPNGLAAGTYVLTGHWFEPCTLAVATGGYPGPCPTPNIPVETFAVARTVNVGP